MDLDLCRPPINVECVAYLTIALMLMRDFSGERMRPHDATVRAAIEQSLGNTLKTMLTPPHGLFVRKPELWQATLQSLERWAPGLAEQLRSTGGLQPITTVASVETKEGTPEGDTAAVVTAVVLEDGVGGQTKTTASSSSEQHSTEAVFPQRSPATETDEEDNCSIQ
eukprot:COSAG02_NODE_3981_length_5956_cov_16.732798_2_plen_167_part_00